MHGQPIFKICNAKQARQIYQYNEDFNKYIICKQIRILCIKLEINQGYTTMHGQPFIKNGFVETVEKKTSVTAVNFVAFRIGTTDLHNVIE